MDMASGSAFVFVTMILAFFSVFTCDAQLDVDKTQIVTELSVTNRTEHVLPSTTQKEADQEIKRNVTFVNQTESGFMPSFHLGPIDTFPTIDSHRHNPTPPTKSLFNNLRAIKFGDEDKSVPPFRPPNNGDSHVKFLDDKDGDKRHDSDDFKGERIVVTSQRHGKPEIEPILPPIVYHQHHQNFDDNYDNEQYVNYDSKPSKFHESLAYQSPVVQGENAYSPTYQSGKIEYFHPDEKIIKPETVINVHPISYQTSSYESPTKPKTIVYVTTHDATRTRKFPYPYYQPQLFDHTEAPVILPEHEEPYQYPLYYEHQEKSVSPWKKILHIIGAFLPLGLLFALLSPRVITADHNGNPNIVLSKLRVNDQPAEHKNNQLVLDTDGKATCEEHSICRLVAAADPTSANFLRHLIEHITERTPESAVRKKELVRIFEAAKLGNCDILTCNFYDGT